MSDGLTINCTNGKEVTMKYVNGSAFQYTVPGGTQTLSDSIVTTGAPIGTQHPDGNVWGCWDQRVWVGLTVEVTEVTPPQPTYKCDMLDVTPGDNRTVRISQFKQSATNGATFKDVVINWGDNSQEFVGVSPVDQTHQYGANGTYIITATAQFMVNGQTVSATSAACKKVVKFENNQPVTPPATVTGTTPTPTALPNTGPGDLLGLFAATTVAGSAAYQLRSRVARRFGL
jgi:hypothetical protein